MRSARFTLFVAAGLLASLCAGRAHAYDYNGTPVASLIHRHDSGDIKDYIQDGWRPTSIEVEGLTGALGSYRVNYVQNVGSHHQEVRYEGEVTWPQLQSIINNGWRVEDLALVGNLLSAILIRNTTNPRQTLPFWGWTVSEVDNWLDDHPDFRLLDLDRYSSGGAERYVGVFLRNTGSAYAPGWGWGAGWTLADIKQWVRDHTMRVIDLDRRPDGLYTWVAVSRKPGERNYYFANYSMSGLLALLGGYGLRAQTITHTAVGSEARYSGTAVNNVGSQAARLADLASPRHNGIQGFYLRQLGGSTLVDLNGTRSMHPSSTIKVLLHFTGVYSTPTDELNTRRLGGILMPTVHSKMMWNSDNTMANLCLDTYTIPFIEAVGHGVGMSQTTQINNRFGTGGPYNNNPYTTTTLADLARLYDRVNAGFFNTTKTAWFRANMLNDTNSGLFDSVLNAVKTEIGISSTRFNDYKSRIRYQFKAGNNSQGGVNGYWSCAGLVTLPRKTITNQATIITSRSYVFGHYVNGTTVDYSSTPGFEATREVLREQIRETMLSFK